jgi:hypothetical protein
MRAARRTIAVLALLLSFAGVTHAGDFCFNSTSPPNPAPPEDPDPAELRHAVPVATRG